MATSTSTPSCPVLTGVENYNIWKLRIRAALKTLGVYGIVDGTDVKPSSLTALTGGSDSKLEWCRREEKVHGTITTHISDTIALKFKDKSKAQGLYAAIKAEFEDQNTGVLAYNAWRNITDARWDGTSSYDDHAAILGGAHQKLTALGKPLDSELLTLSLLASLPSDGQWEVFHTTLLNSTPTGSKLTFDMVDSRICGELAHAAHPSGSSEVALKAGGSGGPPKEKRKCVIHGKCSHTSEECRTILELKRKGRKPAANKAGLTQTM